MTDQDALGVPELPITRLSDITLSDDQLRTALRNVFHIELDDDELQRLMRELVSLISEATLARMQQGIPVPLQADGSELPENT